MTRIRVVPREGTGAEAAADFQDHLEQLLTRNYGRAVWIRSLDREPNAFATRASAETIRVSLDSGERLTLFAKYPAPDGEQNPDKIPPDREIRVYEDLLGDESLPTARFYGVIRNGSARPIAVLEHLEAWNLKYHDLEQWYRSARRLADLHAQFALREELSRPFLLRINADYVRAWMERAISGIEVRSIDLARSLRRLVPRYESVANLLDAQPPTLVHNDLAPKNVLVDVSAEPSRVCIVDWELAGAGCGLLDLVHLKHGLDSAADAEMIRAYREQIESAGLLVSSSGEFDAVVNACDAHNTVYRLAFSSQWRLPLETVAGWIADVERFAADV